jgi:5-methylthioadenosine/S-adenosylhomocysteine deaminase
MSHQHQHTQSQPSRSQDSQYQILVPEWIVTVNSTFEVLTDCALVIKANKIHSIVATNELEQLDFFDQAKLYRLPGQALMPGLVNSHTHASMSLLRGIADDIALMDWLTHHIWPAEQKWMSSQFVTDGFELSAAEMIRSGTTCMNDMYFYPDLVARSAQKLGMRTVVGLIVLDFPTAWAKNADDYLSKALAVHDEVSELPLVTSTLAPHAPYTVSDAPLEKIARYSNDLGLSVHMHIHETAFEVFDAEKNTGKRPLERLDQLNLVNANLIAVHMTQLNDSEIDLLAETGAHVVHCPESNLKLASGMCPVAALQDKAVNVCLGTDGAASNNDLDMFGEMRTATLLAKGVSANPAACTAPQAIQMATINGAKALGLDKDIGSIEVGKLADLIAVNLSHLNTQPLYDVVAQLVYATNSRQVSHVWIDGVCQLEDYQFSQIDEAAIIDKAKIWSTKISN